MSLLLGEDNDVTVEGYIFGTDYFELTANADQGQAHLSPRWSQPALSLRHKDPLAGTPTSRPDFSHHMCHVYSI